MYELRVLGSLDLRGPDGEKVLSVLVQPKRAALLAYLAVATPKGFHRRDKLIGLFWAERDQEHARAALRKALYQLRQSLGEGAVPSRGDEEVGLPEGTVWCDAIAFEAALERGEPEAALDLYQGDLLKGFYISEAPEFESWLGAERERLRGLASEAAWSLAEREEAEGSGVRAASWARKALSFSPDDEAGFRRLLELLDRVGDRAGAMKEYEAFARRLHEVYEGEPSPETQALIAAIREREATTSSGAEGVGETRAADARVKSAEPVPVTLPRERRAEGEAIPLLTVVATYALVSIGVLAAVYVFTLRILLPGWFFPSAVVALLLCLPIILATALVQGGAGAAGAAGAAARPPTAAAWRWLTWRNAAASYVGALALWGAVSAGWLLMDGPGERPEEVASGDLANRIAVFPFTYHGSDEFAYLGETMDELLSTMLDGAGDLRAIPSRTVVATVGEGVSGRQDAELGERAASLGAGRYVVGDVVEVEGQLRIDAWLHSSGGLGGDVVALTSEGVSNDFYGLVDDLTRQLLLELAGSLKDHERLAVRTTESISALKVYLEGVGHLRVRRMRRAIAAFRRATEIDSTFALAWYGIVDAGTWPGMPEYDAAVEAAQQAVRLGERLPPRIRRLVRIQAAYVSGDAIEAERLSREALTRYADDAETWYLLGLALQNFGGFFGRPESEAAEPYKRAYRYNPGDRFFQYFRMWIAAQERDWAMFDSLDVASDYFGGGDLRNRLPFVWRAVRAYGTGDEAGQRQILAEARARGDATPLEAGYYVVHTLGDVSTATELARLAVLDSLAREASALGHVRVAGLELALGRWRAAQARLDRVTSLWPDWATLYRALWAVSPSTPVTEVELRALRDSIAGWDASSVVPSITSTRARAHEVLAPQLRLYALGRLSWRLGEHEAALQRAAELEELGNPPEALTYAVDRALSLRAHVLYEEGRLAEALATLASQPRRLRPQYIWQAMFYQHSEDRFLRGEIYNRLGRLEDARRWYAVIDGSYPYYRYDYTGLAYLRLAEVHERLGDHEQARFQYQRFIDLWRDCDPELRPMVEEARRAIERLLPDPRLLRDTARLPSLK